jgi:hypothetical protein
MTNFNPTRRDSLVLALGALTGLGTQAQTRAMPPTQDQIDAMRRQQLRSAIQREQWRTVVVSETGMRGSMDVASSKPLTGVPALQGFSLGFENGDHKLNRVGVIPGERTTALTLTDQDGNDPFSGRAHFALISSGFGYSKSAVGGGQFEIPMEVPKGGNLVPVLCGFEFIRRVGTDANLRAIGMWIDEARNTIRVTLMDDQGVDFRGFESSVGATLASGLVPYGILIGSAVSTFDAAKRLTEGGKYRQFGVTVHYAWVARDLFEGQDQLTGTSPKPSSGKHFDGPIALTGFEFFFLNSDHHIKHLGVFDPGLQAARGSADHVAYQDNNRDDPIRWAVGYRRLKADRMVRS